MFTCFCILFIPYMSFVYSSLNFSIYTASSYVYTLVCGSRTVLIFTFHKYDTLFYIWVNGEGFAS